MNYIKGYVLTYTDNDNAAQLVKCFLVDQTPGTLTAGQKVITLRSGEKLTVSKNVCKIKTFINE